MKILTATQVREWDQYTITHEPVSSIDLMERAAAACVAWIKAKGWQHRSFQIFCGKGNNGGDGLAIARMLHNENSAVTLFILESGKEGSPEFETNRQRIENLPGINLRDIKSEADLPTIQNGAIIIDAIFGSGLTKPVTGLPASVIKHMNESGATIISIDVPSGLFIDQSSVHHPIVKARYTLSFQCYKMALLVQENAPFIGEAEILDIGLHPDYLKTVDTTDTFLEKTNIRNLFKPRQDFAHKGTFGHALLIGGSYGKIGAMVLAAKACLHTGAGLTTVFIPRCGYPVLQSCVQEAMVLTDDDENYLSTLPDEIEKFDAIGIGPGMDTKEGPQKVVSFILRRYQKPLVIDADALNCLSRRKELLYQLPAHSILTPHPKEFDRLFGDHPNDFARVAKAKQKAIELKIIIVLKSHHTLIALPNGRAYYNSTGNSGMAKGGSGDVLTGVITSLLAQGYPPEDAALSGVYIHGWAGDFAAGKFSRQTMLPSDLISCLSDVFLNLES